MLSCERARGGRWRLRKRGEEERRPGRKMGKTHWSGVRECGIKGGAFTLGTVRMVSIPRA